MANYYTEFSFELDLTKEQHEKGLQLFEKLNEEESDFNNLRYQILEDYDAPSFSLTPTIFSDSHVKWWISSKDGESSTNHVMLFLHYCVMNFNFPPCGFEWVNTCSKPHPDSFGGGAVWITTKGFEWLTTNNWLEERRAKSNLPNQSS